MPENNETISQLADRLDSLLKKQEAFSREVDQIKEEIKKLKSQPVKEERQAPEPAHPKSMSVIVNQAPPVNEPVIHPRKPAYQDEQSKFRADIEKFIGENLINKIGIVITVIGVAIGTKYAIDHELISPITRIILGYLFGLGLLIFALRLRKKYENFSSVLLSGSMAIMYFITYFAFSFYNLFPQTVAFGLMIIITGATVSSAISYNRQVIAHIGLVGAYAVPYLLSTNSGNVAILFTYITIINIGILVISFRKYWKPLYFSSFILTWLIFLTWFLFRYSPGQNFAIASVFGMIYFMQFYLMFLAYKLLQREKFDFYDIILLLANSSIFYFIGYTLLLKCKTGDHFLGLFTLGNAVIHSIASIIVSRQKLADRNLFYFVFGLVIIFLTIAIPVQLNGNWVTLLWTGEAALLFWIGRTQGKRFYEMTSYALVYLAFFSILSSWGPSNEPPDSQVILPQARPFLNISFLTSLIFSASIWFIVRLERNSKYKSAFGSQVELGKIVSFTFAGILLLSLYYTFSTEISRHFDQLYYASLRETGSASSAETFSFYNHDIREFKTVWMINYSLLFLSVISLFNISKIKDRSWGAINLALNAIAIMVFLCVGLYVLSELREGYLEPSRPDLYPTTLFSIAIRYVSLLFAAFLFVPTWKYLGSDFMKPYSQNLKYSFEIMLYSALIWFLSSELLSWMDIMHSTQSYKLALSILWGSYSLLLIAVGIWKNKRHLRIGAIILFAITLLKLFFYDISHLDTISKTIVFVTLGVLLLIISFLYNKYRNMIFAVDMEGKENLQE
jgi:uncharacterized membrane protein